MRGFAIGAMNASEKGHMSGVKQNDQAGIVKGWNDQHDRMDRPKQFVSDQSTELL